MAGHRWKQFALWSVALVCAAPAIAAEPARLSPRDRAALGAKLRATDSAVRWETVRRLAEFPEPGAAKLLVDLGLRDPAADVRQAAYEALLAHKDRAEVCDYLWQRIGQGLRDLPTDTSAALLLSVLLSSNLGELQNTATAFLNDHLAASSSGIALAVATADILAARHEVPDIVPLRRLAESKLAETFVVRRAIVHALAQIDDVAAIDALVNLLGPFEGEARGDAIEYLSLVTGQRFADPAQWTAWWSANRATFQFPWPLARPTVRTFDGRPFDIRSAQGEATFYGFPIFAKRVVFVIDASGSMSGERLTAAKRELARAVSQLSERASFGLVLFNTDVIPWRPRLVEASQAAKAEALQTVDRIVAQGNTATFGSLEAAFAYDAEAIYLLTDGVPTTGRIVEPVEIVRAITAANRNRRQSIYTIGIGPGPEGGPFDDFLRTLAEQNFGLYRRVEE